VLIDLGFRIGLRLFGRASGTQTDRRGEQHCLEEGGGDFHNSNLLKFQMTSRCGRSADSIKIRKNKILPREGRRKV
jgi:hypothetical protein